MRQRKKQLVTILPILAGLMFATLLYGQSLAELARQERERKRQEAKAGKVYTNADIPAATIAATAPSEAASKQEPAKGGEKPAGAATSPTAKEGTKPGEPAPKSEADLEKEYREKFAKLREILAYEEKRLDVMQRELNLMQMQYYSDPNVAMREQYARGEINQRTQDIEAQKATVEKAKQAIVDLEEELRHKNLPPGWAR